MLEQGTQQVNFQSPTWGDDAPRGGKAVLNRIIKEKATVPLFFGQTLISSLRTWAITAPRRRSASMLTTPSSGAQPRFACTFAKVAKRRLPDRYSGA